MSRSLLFDGNRTVLGTDSGGCVRVAEHEWIAAVNGGKSIGVYCICEDGCSVWWGCVDIDLPEAEAMPLAWRLVAGIDHLGGVAWVERSRSRRAHVWIFFNDWMSARRVRLGLHKLCTLLGVPNDEVNPKQESLAPGQVGNYVRLPYPVGWHLTETQCFVDKSGAALDKTSMAEARDRANGFELVEKLWGLVEPPEPKTLSAHSRSEIGPVAITMLIHGPMEDHTDRSAWLFRLACRLTEDGLSESTVAALVTAADTEFTAKFVVRPDSEQRIARLIEAAQSKVAKQ